MLTAVLIVLTLSSLVGIANVQRSPTEIFLQQHNTEFPAVSSPSLTVLPNGSLLAVFSEITKGGIHGKLSDDCGLVWSEPFLIKPSETPYKAYSNFLVVSENKTVLFYSQFANSSSLSLWKLESFDNGQTWTNNVRVDTEAHNYVCTGTNGLRMRNGTLIVPIAWEGNASILRSDDDGETWLESDHIYSASTLLDETAIVELANSSLYCLFRTYVINNNRRHYCSLSNDYGLTWTEPQQVDEMYSFNTTPGLLRVSWNPSLVLACWINRSLSMDVYRRRPLVVAYSLDECTTWKGAKVFDNGDAPDAGNPNAHASSLVLSPEETTNDLQRAYSMNEPSLLEKNGFLLLGYRRYIDNKTDVPPSSDCVLQRFRVGALADMTSITESFGLASNPCADVNEDGIVNILDAILFGK